MEDEALNEREEEYSRQLEEYLEDELAIVVDRHVSIAYRGHSLHDKVQATNVDVSTWLLVQFLDIDPRWIFFTQIHMGN